MPTRPPGTPEVVSPIESARTKIDWTGCHAGDTCVFRSSFPVQKSKVTIFEIYGIAAPDFDCPEEMLKYVKAKMYLIDLLARAKGA